MEMAATFLKMALASGTSDVVFGDLVGSLMGV